MNVRPMLAAAAAVCCSTAMAAPTAHMVFFTLKEPSDANRDKLVAACHKHLSGHEGVSHFSVGVLADGLDREVNDRAFHVALHLVFETREAHDTYQTAPRHLAFIREASSLWSGVRVFDSDLVPAPAAAEPPAAAAE